MARPRQTLAEAIADIRVNLLFQAEYLRQLDEETSEQAAQKLDRLRSNLRRYTETQQEATQ